MTLPMRVKASIWPSGEPQLAAKLRVLPHPTDDSFSYDPSVTKENQIVAVGRWRIWQKDAPRLIKCLGEILRREPDYRASIYGDGEERLKQLASTLDLSVRERIQIHGRAAPSSLVEAYRRSKIIFVPSRYESFHVAAAEALCCGVSVVGSPALPSFIDFAGAHSGTIATSRSVADLVDAAGAEITAWQEQRRDPQQISHHWRNIVSATAVGKTLVREYDTL